MQTRPVQIVIDAQDPAAQAEFWSAALSDRGYSIPDPPEGYPDWPAFLTAHGVPEEDWNAASALEAPGQPRIFFQRVPEPKTVKNRVHIDLLAGAGAGAPLGEQRERVAAAVRRLMAIGATYVTEHTELGVHWAVLRDPEGNEFCA